MKLKDVTKSLSLIFSVSSYDLIKSDNKFYSTHLLCLKHCFEKFLLKYIQIDILVCKGKRKSRHLSSNST